MKNLSILFISLWAAVLSASGQDNIVEKHVIYEGRVVNESGIPIKDAVARAIQTNLSATTGYDGLFTLTLPENGDSVVISKEGLTTFSRRISDNPYVLIEKIPSVVNGKTVEKIIEKVVTKITKKIVGVEGGYNIEYLNQEVIILEPKVSKVISVMEYTRKMAGTATKYFDAGLKFLSDATPDYMKAFACFTRAANMEHEQAAYELAKMYDEGRGIPQDQAKALKWYAKAEGLAGVPLRMAVMYMEGIGTPQDDIKARNYLFCAISDGDTIEAPKRLKELYARHTEKMEKSDSDIMEKSDSDDRIYELVETNAQFPGGDEECFKFIAAIVKYPAKCQEKGIQGTVIVGFVVDRDGSIVDVMTLSSPDPDLAKEAERVVSLMPKWQPARQGNKTVRARFNLPIMFRLN